VTVAARKKTSKATKPREDGPPRSKAAKPSGGKSIDVEVKRRNQKLDTLTVDLIRKTASTVHAEIRGRKKPDLAFPIRSLGNVSYSQKTGYFEIGKQKKIRTLTVNTVKSFAQTLRMMGLSKELVETNDFATKRDAYYQSKNWDEARFDEQTESDSVMDDIEALFSVQGLSREQLRFIPDEHGGAVAGRLMVLDPDRETGEIERIDCTRFGSGAYSIPSSVEQLSFETDAKFILAIETGGIFQRLQSHKYWQTANCILVSMAGVPTRATRRFIRKLSDECKLPVYAFVDCDPYGISNIYRTLKVGSGNAAHLSQFFCVPQARFLGVTPQDIVDYQLPTHPLLDVDIKRARDALKNDPFFKAHKPWQKAMDQLLRMGVRAEQQALAKWGLNFVIEEYLPRKLKNPKGFLP
jgi:DNA topoisomerase-6 subunit A